jgi:hypothetical protein
MITIAALSLGAPSQQSATSLNVDGQPSTTARDG